MTDPIIIDRSALLAWLRAQPKRVFADLPNKRWPYLCPVASYATEALNVWIDEPWARTFITNVDIESDRG